MKIVCTDNFNRETRSDSLIAENIANEEIANFLCECLRKKYSSNDSPDWFIVKQDEEPLYVFEP